MAQAHPAATAEAMPHTAAAAQQQLAVQDAAIPQSAATPQQAADAPKPAPDPTQRPAPFIPNFVLNHGLEVVEEEFSSSDYDDDEEI